MNGVEDWERADALLEQVKALSWEGLFYVLFKLTEHAHAKCNNPHAKGGYWIAPDEEASEAELRRLAQAARRIRERSEDR